jgi:hypothetical protein
MVFITLDAPSFAVSVVLPDPAASPGSVSGSYDFVLRLASLIFAAAGKKSCQGVRREENFFQFFANVYCHLEIWVVYICVRSKTPDRK